MCISKKKKKERKKEERRKKGENFYGQNIFSIGRME